VTNEPRRAAFAASPGRDVQITKAIPAKAGRPVGFWRGRVHGTSGSEGSSSSTSRAAANGRGVEFGSRREGGYGRVIAQMKIQHAGEKMRIGGGRAQRLRADPAFGQEQARRSGVAGDERKALEPPRFQLLRGGCECALSLVVFAFP